MECGSAGIYEHKQQRPQCKDCREAKNEAVPKWTTLMMLGVRDGCLTTVQTVGAQTECARESNAISSGTTALARAVP